LGGFTSKPWTTADTRLRRSSLFPKICDAEKFKFAMLRFKRVGISYGDLRKQCLAAIREWPGCDTVSGIQIIRDNSPAGFLVRVTLYAQADPKIADRAMIYIEREKRRHFHLTE
jgi:hypothetical protein